jgi:hypothetical protein
MVEESPSDLGFVTLHNDRDTPLEGTPNFPTLYQVFIHWESILDPFPITVRADMTIDDLLISLISILQISKIYMFLFLDNCMLHRLQRLDEHPVVGPGHSHPETMVPPTSSSMV